MHAKELGDLLGAFVPVARAVFFPDRQGCLV